MRLRSAIVALIAVSLTGCGTASGPDSAPSGSATAGGDTFVMPNEVGSDLQNAQDDVQRIAKSPLYQSTSHDDTGAGRSQFLDSDWKVCSQTPDPGTTVQLSTPVDFGVVKDSEQCP